MSNLIVTGDSAVILVPDPALIDGTGLTDKEWEQKISEVAGLHPDFWEMAELFELTVFVTTKVTLLDPDFTDGQPSKVYTYKEQKDGEERNLEPAYGGGFTGTGRKNRGV